MPSEITAPLLSGADDLSGYDEARIYEKRHSSLVTPALLFGLLAITALILIIYVVFRDSISKFAGYVVYSLATLTGTSFICGMISWLALRLILRPCCHSRGATEIRELVETLFAQYIFSRDVIDQFMTEKMIGLDRHAIETDVTRIMTSSELMELIDETLDNFFRSAGGSEIEMRGVSKRAIRPFVLDAVKRAVMPNCVDFVTAILSLDALSPEALSDAAMAYLLRRCEEMDPDAVSDVIEEVIGSNATLVVCYGVAAGAFFCIAARCVMYFL
jgi:hypothetical protein